MRCSQKAVHGLPWFYLSGNDRFVLQGVWAHFTMGMLLGWTVLGSFKDWQTMERLPKPSGGAQMVQDPSQLFVFICAQDSTGITRPIQDNVAGGSILCMAPDLCANMQMVMVA